MAAIARSVDTRRRLLEAALEVFAREGYRKATIQQICSRAGANIAAANYHFGGKAALYAAVFAHASRRADASPAPELPSDATPEERLRIHVTSFLTRLLDPERPAWMAQLIAREMIEPTPELDGLVRRRMRANHAQISAAIRDLLGRATSDDTVRLCTLSVVAQCVFYRNSAPVISRLYPDLVPSREVERIANHVTRFSVAAVRALAAAANGDSEQ
jgi:AcrR family transcriptional regulator